MGWSSGNSILTSLIEACADAGLETGQKYIIYEAVVETLQDLDCDTLSEVYGTDAVLDEVLEEQGLMEELIQDEEEQKEEGW